MPGHPSYYSHTLALCGLQVVQERQGGVGVWNVILENLVRRVGSTEPPQQRERVLGQLRWAY